MLTQAAVKRPRSVALECLQALGGIVATILITTAIVLALAWIAGEGNLNNARQQAEFASKLTKKSAGANATEVRTRKEAAGSWKEQLTLVQAGAKTLASGTATPATPATPAVQPDAWKKVDMAKLRAFATALDPEIVNSAAPDGKYDPAYKNPCWMDAASSTLKCLPYFYILGGFHSGVTSLANKVSRHPSILTDGSSFMQFWAEDGKPMSGFINGFVNSAKAVQADPSKIIMEGSQSTLAFYLAAGAKAHRHFSSTFSPCWKNCTAGPHNQEQLDACVGSRCYPAAQQADRKVAPQFGFDYVRDQHVPLLMRAAYGDKPPRLIVVIRDPIDRLHSAFYGYPHYFNKHGRHPEGFYAYVKEQVTAFQACVGRYKSDEECALYFEALGVPEEKVYFHCDQIMRGMYSVFLSRWLALFGRDNLLVIKAEDMFRDMRGAITSIFKFLGLPEPDEQGWETIKFAGPPTSYAKDQVMMPEAQKLLSDFYRPYNERLAELLGDPSLVNWNQRVV